MPPARRFFVGNWPALFREEFVIAWLYRYDIIAIYPRKGGVVLGKTSSLHRVAIVYLLLFLASTHCVMSSFYVNFSYLDLSAYAFGREKNPYQERIGMMPLLRAAHDSNVLRHITEKLRHAFASHPHSTFKNISSEEVASMAAALACAYLLVIFAAWYGRRNFGKLWWMPAALMIVMLYITQAARYETTVWYPYDFPHILLFGIASILILDGRWQAAFVLFLADIPFRETSIFLAGIAAAVAYSRRQYRQAVAVPLAMFGCWLVFRIGMHHWFQHNPSEIGIHLQAKKQAIFNPAHWPQVMSAFGFLLIPLLLARRYLPRKQQFFLLGAIPGLIVTLIFGVWMETRIFSEWIPVAAVLLTIEFARFLQDEGAKVEAFAVQ